MIPLFKVHIPEDVDGPLLKTLHSGYITQGPKVDEFEKAFGKYIDNPLTIALNSGTSALTLALRLANVGPGDEVITTPMTCSATNLPILSLGATPVFADIDPDTGLIDPGSVLSLLTPQTKAVMFVDWGGMPAEVHALKQLCERKNIKLIEDAAHALGAMEDGDKVGSIADFTCFSLQAIKHITTIDGGMLAVLDPADYERGRRLRWFGIDRKTGSKDTRIDEDIEEWGYKFHMNDIAATIGLVQLDHADRVISEQRRYAKTYDRYLSSYFKVPRRASVLHSYWLYTILLPSQDHRNQFKDFMSAAGIMVSQVHRRNDEYSVFEPYKNFASPGVADFSERMICIPVHWALDAYQVGYIIEQCNLFAEQHSGKTA